jgi:hypothetical protein
MPLTLLEASKGEDVSIFRRGVIETFVGNKRLLQALPFREISGSHDGILQEEVLPNAATRGVNESFVASEGRFAEIVQGLKIYGGEIGIDPFILRTKGQDQAAKQIALHIKAIQNRWMLDFFKGDAGADPRDFDGLQNRLALTSFQVIDAGATSGGNPLSLRLLDEAIARNHAPEGGALLMGQSMWVRFQQAARDQNVGGILSDTLDQFGRRVLRYGDRELMMITDAANADTILGFTEAALGGGSTASSIYVIGFGDEGLEGISNGGFQVRNLGEDENTPIEKTRVEWYTNFHINHPRAVIRVRSISNAPFVS